MYVLGYDIGSSSVKASLVNVESGKCAASAFFPKTEAPILAVKQGWAEQDPQSWWDNLKLATQAVLTASGAKAEEINAKRIEDAKHAAGITEETNTFAKWKELGYKVKHGASALFGCSLIWGSRGDGATYKASFFGKSQVEAI